MRREKLSLIIILTIISISIIISRTINISSIINPIKDIYLSIFPNHDKKTIFYIDNPNSLSVTTSEIYQKKEWIIKNFQVISNNSTELAMYYKVKLVIDKNEYEEDLFYTLDSVNLSDNGAPITGIKEGKISGTKCEEFGMGYFITGEEQKHNYILKIDFKDKEKNNKKINFAAHLEIEQIGTFLANPKGWSTASEGTLLAAIRSNYNEPVAPLTPPGLAESSGIETVMGAAPDDYGTSYYFRGNVQNNFVSFANMCWRIVRITGDGSIKLVLYNYSNASCTQLDDNLAFARYQGDTYTTSFNPDSNDNAYVGFMYGTAGSSTYAATHENKNKSTILTNLETWYQSKLSNYENKLADVIWCNDKSVSSGKGINTSISNYGAEDRLKNPSLICPNDNEGGNLSKYTVNDTINGNGALDYKIGLLTIDEMLYAGLKNNGTNTDFNFLNENAGPEIWWWSLSPSHFDGLFVQLFNTYSDGDIESGMVNYVDCALRPAIALKSNTTITSGIGTAISPFTVS